MVKQRPDRKRTYIWIYLMVMLVTILPFFGEVNIGYNYVRTRYNWGVVRYSEYRSITEVMNLVGQAIAIPLFGYLQVGRPGGYTVPKCKLSLGIKTESVAAEEDTMEYVRILFTYTRIWARNQVYTVASAPSMTGSDYFWNSVEYIFAQLSKYTLYIRYSVHCTVECVHYYFFFLSLCTDTTLNI